MVFLGLAAVEAQLEASWMAVPEAQCGSAMELGFRDEADAPPGGAGLDSRERRVRQLKWTYVINTVLLCDKTGGELTSDAVDAMGC